MRGFFYVYRGVMSTDTPSTQEQQESEQQLEAQEADDALEAGFSQARGEEPPAKEPADQTKPDASAEPADKDKKGNEGEPTKTTAEPEKPPVVLAGLSEQEIAALFQKVPGLEAQISENFRKVYGKFGELQGYIQKIQGSRHTPKIQKGGLKRLNEEFPEIAEMLAEDLADIFGAAEAAPPAEAKTQPQPPPPQQAAATQQQPVDVQGAVNAAVAQVEKKLLTVLHSDWQTIVTSDEFSQFLQGLPEADRTKYVESDDSIVAAECFSKFKEWKGKAQQANAGNKKRLEKAITPKGEGQATATTLDDDAAFESGFKSVRRR